jgi:hypothetical protein
MKNRDIFTAVIALTLLSAGAAIAHVPYLEPEVARRWGPASEGDDFSFEHPFIIPNGTISQSKAIFAYLSYGDVDVYKYTVQEGETVPLLMCAAMVPACRVYRSTYPSTALLGPGLPTPDASENLPFDVPKGYGALIAHQTRVPLGEKRPVFSLSADMPGTNISWFFPANLQTDFIFVSNITVPGDYYIVIWNSTKLPCDYTASIGLSEEFSAEDKIRVEVIIPLYSDQKMLRFPCSEMEGPSPFGMKFQ